MNDFIGKSEAGMIIQSYIKLRLRGTDIQICINPHRTVWDKCYPGEESHHRLDDSFQPKQFQEELITGNCLLATIPVADLKEDLRGLLQNPLHSLSSNPDFVNF